MGRVLLLVVWWGWMAGVVAADEKAEGPFRHDTHAALKLPCTYCHAGAEKEDQASFPSVGRCRGCHTGVAEDRQIPAQRVYRVKDFVFFSHRQHTGATGDKKVECATCHGSVYTMPTLKVERPLTMAACVSCHKERDATVACNVCHELGQ